MREKHGPLFEDWQWQKNEDCKTLKQQQDSDEQEINNGEYT